MTDIKLSFLENYLNGNPSLSSNCGNRTQYGQYLYGRTLMRAGITCRDYSVDLNEISLNATVLQKK